MLYFQVLDADYNELQRMRSVVQLQPGEQRSCVGCHDNRQAAPTPRLGIAFASPPEHLEPPPWGAGPFDYEKVVQPVLNRRCVECHDGAPDTGPDLRGVRVGDRVPASYRSLIAGGWVHYFDSAYGARHFKAEPLSFGTLRSSLFAVLESETHREVGLEPNERRALEGVDRFELPALAGLSVSTRTTTIADRRGRMRTSVGSRAYAVGVAGKARRAYLPSWTVPFSLCLKDALDVPRPSE